MYKAGLRFIGTFVLTTAILLILGVCVTGLYIVYKDNGEGALGVVLFLVPFCIGIHTAVIER